ncbi:MAG: hypothetical protein U1F76_17500 [Candidatus Competibacteraceae bacterium]
MAKTLKIPGKVADPSSKSAELAEGDVPLHIQVQQVIDITKTRAAGEAVSVDVEPAAKD